MRFCIAALLAVCFSVSATTYGRSKIQVEGYEWWTITARGVQLYYPVGCETLAESLLAISTAEIDKLAFEFGFMPEDEISIVAYPPRAPSDRPTSSATKSERRSGGSRSTSRAGWSCRSPAPGRSSGMS